MQTSERQVLEAAYDAWAARDLAATMACFAEDAVFVMHLPADVAPFAGEVRGKDHLRPHLQRILDDFDFLAYEPLQITADGERFHTRVHFRYRHKATGHVYDGTMRHVWRVEGGRIVRFEEFHDAERVRAFFALLAQAARNGASTAE